MEYFTYSTIYSSYFFLLIANIVGILKYKFLMKDEKLYIYYLLYTLLIELSVNISIELFEVNLTGIIYPLYIGGVFFILTYLYSRKVGLPKIWSLIIPFFGILYLSTHHFFANINHDYVKVLSNIVIFSFAGTALLQEINKPNLDNRFLWADAFVFLYYSVSAFIFILHNELGNMDVEQAYLIWGINNILTCFLYSSLIYSFLKLKK